MVGWMSRCIRMMCEHRSIEGVAFIGPCSGVGACPVIECPVVNMEI